MTTTPGIRLRLHSSNNGFNDYDVIGHKEVHRLCVGHGIKKRDICNVYGPSSTKRGAQWTGSAEKTLSDFLDGESVTIEDDATSLAGLMSITAKKPSTRKAK